MPADRTLQFLGSALLLALYIWHLRLWQTDPGLATSRVKRTQPRLPGARPEAFAVEAARVRTPATAAGSLSAPSKVSDAGGEVLCNDLGGEIHARSVC